jgi:excisionase family DNA binding protein
MKAASPSSSARGPPAGRSAADRVRSQQEPEIRCVAFVSFDAYASFRRLRMLPLRYATPDESLSADAAAAAKSLAGLATTAKGRKAKRIALEARDESRRVTAEVPMEVFQLFLQLLTELAQGHAVTIVPGTKEVTTQEAADLLNVSRPYVVQLLEEGKIPFRRVGTRRRIRFEDLMAFKKRDDAARRKIADALAKEAEQLGLEY